MNKAYQRLPFRIRMEWGLDGAQALGGADVAIVVDVLSFSTCVSVAVDVGITVLPYPWAGAGVAAYAREHDAVLAVGRAEALPGQISLSPGSIRSAAGVTRLVLPIPQRLDHRRPPARAGRDGAGRVVAQRQGPGRVAHRRPRARWHDGRGHRRR